MTIPEGWVFVKEANVGGHHQALYLERLPGWYCYHWVILG